MDSSSSFIAPYWLAASIGHRGPLRAGGNDEPVESLEIQLQDFHGFPPLLEIARDSHIPTGTILLL